MRRLVLPFPPSVNCLYTGNHRRFKSKRYTDWIAQASQCIEAGEIIDGFIQVTYRLSSPDNRRRDVANGEKALSDLLVSQKVIKDDSLIQRLIMEWADDLEPGLVEVIIDQMEFLQSQ